MPIRNVIDDLPQSPSPLPLYCKQVPATWLDYNGHMSEFRYLELICSATDQLLASLRMDAAYIAAGTSFFTVETHLRHLEEGYRGDLLEVRTQLVESDLKRLHIFHTVSRPGEAVLIATAEQMLLHVDRDVGKAVPAKEAVSSAIAEMIAEHRQRPIPDAVGRSIVFKSRPEHEK